MVYNFLSYFVTAVSLVFLTIIVWFIYQVREENRILRRRSDIGPKG